MKKVNRLRKRMEQNRKYFIPSLVLLTALGTGIYGVSSVDAQESGSQTSIAERIASRFNLNKDDVQKVFDENRTERQKLMQTNFEKKLSDAVSAGEITEAQKTLIIGKRAEMEKQRETMKANRQQNWENLKNMTAADRKTEIEKRQAEMKTYQEEIATWAKNNGIDIKYLMGLAGRHGGPDRIHGNMAEAQ